MQFNFVPRKLRSTDVDTDLDLPLKLKELAAESKPISEPAPPAAAKEEVVQEQLASPKRRGRPPVKKATETSDAVKAEVAEAAATEAATVSPVRRTRNRSAKSESKSEPDDNKTGMASAQVVLQDLKKVDKFFAPEEQPVATSLENSPGKKKP